MSKTSKIVTYLFELILATILILIDLRLFLVYAFMALLIGLDMKVDYLRKLVRVFEVWNETKLIAIQRKMQITNEDITKIAEENMEKLTEEQRKSLEKDLQDILRS